MSTLRQNLLAAGDLELLAISQLRVLSKQVNRKLIDVISEDTKNNITPFLFCNGAELLESN